MDITMRQNLCFGKDFLVQLCIIKIDVKSKEYGDTVLPFMWTYFFIFFICEMVKVPTIVVHRSHCWVCVILDGRFDVNWGLYLITFGLYKLSLRTPSMFLELTIPVLSFTYQTCSNFIIFCLLRGALSKQYSYHPRRASPWILAFWVS